MKITGQELLSTPMSFPALHMTLWDAIGLQSLFYLKSDTTVGFKRLGLFG